MKSNGPAHDPESQVMYVVGEETMEPGNGKENKPNRKRKQRRQQVPDSGGVKQPKLDPLVMASVAVAFAKNDRQRVFRLLWIPDDERNFSVIKQPKGRALVALDGHRFVICSARPKGACLWKCEMWSLYKCKFCITITADGKIASFVKGSIHSHPQARDRLFDCPLGKGMLPPTQNDEKHPFWLITDPNVVNELDRHFIYDNQKYSLRNFFGLVDASEWHCQVKKCPVRSEVRGVFQSVTFSGGSHNHPPMDDRDVQEALQASKINSTTIRVDVVTPFRELRSPIRKKPLVLKNRIHQPLAKKLAVPEINEKLAVPDSGRNFEVLRIKEHLYKIRFEHRDYKFSLKLTDGDGSTLWKCVWECIHNCAATITMSKTGQRAQSYGPELHCHPPELAPILGCELRKHSVPDVTSDASETIQLLARECSYFDSRSAIFRSHVYNLHQIVNRTESRWSCVRPGSNGQQCSASLVINGQMESFLHNGEHCDPAMSDRQLEHIVLPGNLVNLSVNHGNNADLLKLLKDLKKQLFEYPQGRATIWNEKISRNEQFHFVRDHARRGDAAHVVFYQNHRYSFASIDEFGVSQWVCSKLLRANITGQCHAQLTIEGVFQRITADEGEDHHEAAMTMDYLYA